MPKTPAAKKIRNSQDALVCGESFQRLAERLIPAIWTVKEGSYHVMPNEMGDLVACATNLAFAVELYLKGILIQLRLDVPMSHNLRNLYGLIPQPVRTQIESIYETVLPDEVRRLGGQVSFTSASGPLEEPLWHDYKVSLALPDLLSPGLCTRSPFRALAPLG